ncbi:MAG: phage holin [Oscillospiraceae bacterium]|nr:phage holin [Lentisphaeria bacterium]MBO7421940.1 phage holin [Oscillospiraceae bacterium]
MKMSNKVYDVLKFIAQIVLPAVATLYATLGKIWGWPLVTEITATICAVDTFLGAILGISSAQYNKQQPPDED